MVLTKVNILVVPMGSHGFYRKEQSVLPSLQRGHCTDWATSVCLDRYADKLLYQKGDGVRKRTRITMGRERKGKWNRKKGYERKYGSL